MEPAYNESESPVRVQISNKSVFVSSSRDNLNIVVKDYIKTDNFKKYITFRDIDI